MKRFEKFNAIWTRMEEVGEVDCRGSSEYGGTLMEWIAAGCPKDIFTFAQGRINFYMSKDFNDSRPRYVAIPAHITSNDDLFDLAFDVIAEAYPPGPTREEVRQIVADTWPGNFWPIPLCIIETFDLLGQKTYGEALQ